MKRANQPFTEFSRVGLHDGPSWSLRYRLGVEASRQIDTCCTLRELGDALGVTKQNAYTESVLALGTLVWRVRERLQLNSMTEGR